MNSSNTAVILAAVFGIGVVVTSGMTIQQRSMNTDLRDQVDLLQKQVSTLEKLTGKTGAQIVVEAPDQIIASTDSGASASDEEVSEPGTDAEIVEVEAVEKPKPEAQPERRRNRSWQDRIEDLKENDPERYAEIKKRMDGMREGFEKVLAEQSAFFLSLDTELMTDEQLANHNELLEVMEGLWTMTEASETEGDTLAMPQISQEMGQKMWKMGDLLEKEREIALEQMGRQMGYDDAGAKLYSEQVQDVYQKTSMRSYFRGFGRGNWGRRGNQSGQGGQQNNGGATQGAQP